MAKDLAGEQNPATTIELLPLERQWIAKAVITLRAQLARARSKELSGSEIYNLRGKEIQMLDSLYNRLL